MSDYVQKEKYEGVYLPTAERIKFNIEWSGHRFTEEECRALLAGESITFQAYSERKKKNYTAHGKLEFQIYNDHPFWGFAMSDSVPDEFCGHAFTDEEKQMLERGEMVHCTDFISKKNGKPYSANVIYKDNGEGKMKLFLDFDKR